MKLYKKILFFLLFTPIIATAQGKEILGFSELLFGQNFIKSEATLKLKDNIDLKSKVNKNPYAIIYATVKLQNKVFDSNFNFFKDKFYSVELTYFSDKGVDDFNDTMRSLNEVYGEGNLVVFNKDGKVNSALVINENDISICTWLDSRNPSSVIKLFFKTVKDQRVLCLKYSDILIDKEFQDYYRKSLSNEY